MSYPDFEGCDVAPGKPGTDCGSGMGKCSQYDEYKDLNLPENCPYYSDDKLPEKQVFPGQCQRRHNKYKEYIFQSIDPLDGDKLNKNRCACDYWIQYVNAGKCPEDLWDVYKTDGAEEVMKRIDKVYEGSETDREDFKMSVMKLLCETMNFTNPRTDIPKPSPFDDFAGWAKNFFKDMNRVMYFIFAIISTWILLRAFWKLNPMVLCNIFPIGGKRFGKILTYLGVIVWIILLSVLFNVRTKKLKSSPIVVAIVSMFLFPLIMLWFLTFKVDKAHVIIGLFILVFVYITLTVPAIGEAWADGKTMKTRTTKEFYSVIIMIVFAIILAIVFKVSLKTRPMQYLFMFLMLGLFTFIIGFQFVFPWVGGAFIMFLTLFLVRFGIPERYLGDWYGTKSDRWAIPFVSPFLKMLNEVYSQYGITSVPFGSKKSLMATNSDIFL